MKFWHLFHLLKSDVKPEKFDCEKTEPNGITDRSHKTTVTRRLGMQKLHCRLDGMWVCMQGPTRGD